MKAERKALTKLTALAVVAISTFALAQDSTGAGGGPLQMVSANVWLDKALDAKKAKQGDQVTLKMPNDTKIPNSRDLPKNTLLLGHVDSVQPSVDKSNSSIQVTFDKARLKSGEELSVKVTIMRIYPSPSFGPQGGGSVPNDQLRPAPTGPDAARNPGSAGPPPGSGGQSGQANEDANGVLLKSDIHENSSGTFTSKGRNVYIGGGTQLQIGVVVVPPAP